MSLPNDVWFNILIFISLKDIKTFLLISRETINLLNDDRFYKISLMKKSKEIEKWKFPQDIKFSKLETWKESFIQWIKFHGEYKTKGSFESVLKAQKRHLILETKNTCSITILIYLEEQGSSVITSCAICRNAFGESCIGCKNSCPNENCLIAIGKCEHAYHLHCIETWLLRREVCPMDNSRWEDYTIVGL